MPCQELEPIKPMDPPSSIVEITARKTLMASGAKGKGRHFGRRRVSRTLRSLPAGYLNSRRSAVYENQPAREYDKTATREHDSRLSPLDEQKRYSRPMVIFE